MKFLLTVFCLFVFILASVSFTSANIQSTINIINSDNGEFQKVRVGDELSLIYDFNTGESINREIFVSQVDSLDLSKALFCYGGCNIVPKRSIHKTWIKDNEETLSLVNARIDGNEHNQIFDIYLGDKITTTDSQTQQTSLDFSGNEEVTIFWLGNISVEDSGQYEFLLNISGEILSLDINEDDKILIENNTFKVNLEEGNNKIKIVYSTNKKENINLFWKYLDKDFLVIPDENLKFEKGLIKENTNQPQVRSFSVSQFPSSYQIDYSVYPTAVKGYYSITSGRTPILLVHGLHGSDDIDTENTATWTYWHSVPTKLKDKDNDVWVLFYMPANVSNFLTSGMLKNEINDVLSYYSVSKLDVVSHSMGGLVTMGYLSSLGKDRFGNSVNYGNNIRKYVAIGAPAHGAFSANRILLKMNTASTGCNTLARLFGVDPSDKNAQAYLDLAVGSEFTWLLHESSLPTEISYLTITGNEGILCVPDETKESNSGDSGAGNDGLVAVSSASLLDKNIPLIILGDYNHANEIGDSAVPLLSFNPQKEVNVIDSFIKGQSVNTIKSNLENGDYYIDPNTPSSNVFTRGSVVLKITSNMPINSVNLKNPFSNQEYTLTEFEDLRHNTQTNNWFYFSDDDLSMPYSNQKYGLTFPSGDYDIYVNGEDTGQNVVIKGAQTTMQEIEFVNTKEMIDFKAKISIIPQLTCAEYNYWIELGQFNTLPNGLSFDINNPINTNHVRVNDLDGKSIDMFTYDECVSCGIAPTCQTTAQFSSVLYNGLSINQDSCTTTSSQTEICWEESDRVIISRELSQSSCISGVCCNLATETIKPFGAQPNDLEDIPFCNEQTRKLQNYYCDGVNTNTYNINESILEICTENQECSPNACLDILSNPTPKVEILNNEFFYNQNDIEFSFNVTDWNVSGKGQDHVHFHADGIPGLNFSDHLMFYNSPDNVVELNLESGPTLFATWINSNTIRINNIPNGLTKLRTHLATSAHTIPTNSEADIETEFLVSSTENVYGLTPNNNSGTDDDAILGESNAPITMIMFGGYEESFSRKFYNETFPQIKSQYIDTGKINFVFRDFPLVVLFPFDQFAAEVAECVGEFGDEAYYEMFNELFEKGLENADDLGYDIEDCVFSGQMAQEVVQDDIDAQEMGVVGSPTFFISGEIFSGARPFEDFQEVIERKLNESIICFTDLDCGINGFIDSPFCSVNDVAQNFQNFTCVNPGTIQSSCIAELTPTIMETCSDTCSEGQCVEIECSLDSDCDDNNPETTDICHDAGTIQSSCENIEPEPTPELIVNSPQNQVYNDRRIPFEIEINEIVDEITYIDLADDRGRERRLCSNCDSYGLDRTRTQSFVDGGHNISIKAMKDEVVVDEKIVSFMTDSRDPRISRTEPQRGFSNGVFNVEFTEENPTELILFYGNSIRNKTVDIENDCVEARRGFECETDADVSDFDGGNIEYWFELTDIAGSKDESRHEELSVDISDPIIEDLEYKASGRNVYFTMRIIEQNLDEVYYLDNSDERARERSICRRLNGDVCEGRTSFSDGEHNITIYAVDEAGNMAKEDLLFFVDSRDPKISRTEPRRGFASGVFSVEFDEENPISLFLNYGNSQTGFRNKEVDIDSSCIIDRRYGCETEVNLSDYHGQEIVYWFNISDILNQTDESRETSLDVDTVAPILNNPDSFWEQDGRNVYFAFNVTEENFDEANYLDLNDDRARERRLCSRLRDGVCEGRASFRSGSYELLIKILDDAGNSIEEFIEFTVS